MVLAPTQRDGQVSATSLAPRIASSTYALLGLARAGRIGRLLAPRVDLLHALGGRALLDRRRAEDGFASAEVDARAYRRIWHDAAVACGADVIDLGRGFHRLNKGGRSTTVCRHLVQLDDVATAQLALDKPLTQTLLAGAGLQVPRSLVVRRSSWRDGIDFVSDVGRCVLKPATQTGGGLGVTGGIETTDDLARAAVRAGRYDELLMLEEHVVGVELRFLLLDGEPLDVLVRTPPSVTGDGRSSIRSLIRAENWRRRHSGDIAALWPIRIDLDCAFALRDAGLALSSVLEPGRRVRVKSTANEAGTHDSCSVRDYPPALLAEARRAAAALCARYCSVELIAPEGSGRPWILEINATPGLHYHYPTPATAGVSVAERLLGTLLEIDPASLSR